MSQVVKLTFGPIQENTFIIYDETLECAIIDPGCANAREREQLIAEISKLNLKPVRLLNTHCHVDHIPGNPLIANTYNIGLEVHPLEEQVLRDHVSHCVADAFASGDPAEQQHKVEELVETIGRMTR